MCKNDDEIPNCSSDDTKTKAVTKIKIFIIILKRVLTQFFLWQICLKTDWKLICAPNNAAIYINRLISKMIIRILYWISSSVFGFFLVINHENYQQWLKKLFKKFEKLLILCYFYYLVPIFDKTMKNISYVWKVFWYKKFVGFELQLWSLKPSVSFLLRLPINKQ